MGRRRFCRAGVGQGPPCYRSPSCVHIQGSSAFSCVFPFTVF